MAQQKPLFLAAFGAFQNSSYFCPFSGSKNTSNIVPGNTAHLCKISHRYHTPHLPSKQSVLVRRQNYSPLERRHEVLGGMEENIMACVGVNTGYFTAYEGSVALGHNGIDRAICHSDIFVEGV
ncbi:MAG: hypothetical protein KBB67_14575 [Syntrophorhabdus sp.]|jgi:hypothetical protein|nr:hypothetical protein [Syntrophorhabdus sp.]